MRVRGRIGILRLGSTSLYISLLFHNSSSNEPSLEKLEAKVTGTVSSHLSGSLLSHQRLEESSRCFQGVVQSRQLLPEVSRKETGTISRGPGIPDDFPAPTSRSSCLACSLHTHRCAGVPRRALGGASAASLLISQAGPSPTCCFYSLKIKRAGLGISG